MREGSYKVLQILKILFCRLKKAREPFRLKASPPPQNFLPSKISSYGRTEMNDLPEWPPNNQCHCLLNHKRKGIRGESLLP